MRTPPLITRGATASTCGSAVVVSSPIVSPAPSCSAVDNRGGCTTSSFGSSSKPPTRLTRRTSPASGRVPVSRLGSVATRHGGAIATVMVTVTVTIPAVNGFVLSATTVEGGNGGGKEG